MAYKLSTRKVGLFVIAQAPANLEKGDDLSRISMFAASCAVAALFAVVQPRHANAQSAVAATAAHNCSLISAASRHRSSNLRVLSAVQTSKAQHYCTKLTNLSSIAHAIQRHRLWVAPRYKYWWDIKNKQWRTVVHAKRAKLHRILQRDIPWLAGRIHALVPEPRLAHDWLYQAFMCIHHGEGSWNDTRNPTYNGGLQMDKYFEASYGADFVVKYGGYIATDAAGHKYAVGGHAYLWQPSEQIEAAERAYRSGRGFRPWPYTAHDCKLI